MKVEDIVEITKRLNENFPNCRIQNINCQKVVIETETDKITLNTETFKEISRASSKKVTRIGSILLKRS